MNTTKLTSSYLDVFSSLSISPLTVAACVAVIAGGTVLGLALLRRTDPATAFASGMGLYVLLLTSLGVMGLDLRIGLALTAIGILAATWLLREQLAPWARPAGLVLVLLAPLLLLLSDRHGSEWDEFSHWLHAFRYLATHHRLPGGPDAPAMASCCAAYPYAWPMVGEAAMALIGFSEAVPALLNTLVLGLFAILLASLAANEARLKRPGLGLWAAGLLAATVAAPSFVPKLAFSAYADVATAFLVATLVIAGERLGAGEDNKVDGLRWASAFGLIGGALLAVKPGNAALFACVLGASAVVALRRQGFTLAHRAEFLPALVLPLLCAGLWRWHVGKYLSGQEMGLRPFAEWNIHFIPAIAKAMFSVASQKGGHFGLGLVITALGLWGLVRCRHRFDRLCAIAGMLFVGYNLFLLTTYVAVFGPQDGLAVMSFWRYNTHAGLALMLPAAMVCGRLLGRFAERRWMKATGSVAVALAILGPLILAPQIRFDLDGIKRNYRQTLRLLLDQIPAGENVAVVDPLGSGLSRVMAIYEWNNRLGYGGGFSAFDSAEPKAWLNARPADWAIVLSGPERLGLEPANGALLVRRSGTTWLVVDQFPYPGGLVPPQWP